METMQTNDSTTATLEVYDPAMCCATGACGPEPDADLAEFAADLQWLEQQRLLHVRRFNLAQEPLAFADNPQVRAIMDETEGEGLPIVALSGRVLIRGAYPTRTQLALWTRGLVKPGGLKLDRSSAQDDPPDACCAGGNCG